MALKQVVSYLPDQCMGLSLGLTQDVFVYASHLQQRILGEPMDVKLVSVDGEPVTTFSGLQISVDGGLDDVELPDLVIVHAWWGDIESQLEKQKPLMEKLKYWHENGVSISAPTTASYFLAQAGLLDNRLCTTHWHKHDELQQLYPKIKVHSERFITSSGGLYCSAGMNAGLEVMAHVLAQLSCPQVAKAVEDAFLVDFRRGYTSESISQSINMQQQSAHQDDGILEIQQWLELHFSEALTLESIAQKGNMSLRTFKRRFKAATGTTPLNYLQQLRIEQGKDLLKHTGLSISQIAWDVGYEDAGHFGRLFKRLMGLTPAQWRKQDAVR